MKGDCQVIAQLDRYLSIELTGHKQYLLDAGQCEHWGLQRLHQRQLEYSHEETRHATRLAARILFLEGTPAMQDYRAAQPSTDIVAQLRGNLALIAAALEVLGEGVRLAESAGDFVSRALFAEMLADEEAHTDWLETQLELIERIGVGAYLQTQIHT
jgi:bacterioferritin